jgi:hypothetical protein
MLVRRAAWLGRVRYEVFSNGNGGSSDEDHGPEPSGRYGRARALLLVVQIGLLGRVAHAGRLGADMRRRMRNI